MLRPRTPRTISHRKAIHRNALPVKSNLTCDVSGLIEVRCGTERRFAAHKRMWLRDSTENEIDGDKIPIQVAETIIHERLQHADREAVGEREISEIPILGQRLGVRVVIVGKFPRNLCRIVPDEDSTGRYALVGISDPIEPSRDLSLWHVERKPAGLSFPRIIPGTMEVIIVAPKGEILLFAQISLRDVPLAASSSLRPHSSRMRR
jgi:hypothetical protein